MSDISQLGVCSSKVVPVDEPLPAHHIGAGQQLVAVRTIRRPESTKLRLANAESWAGRVPDM